ncbi:MAG: polyphosphate polymerase domain-containing protein [Lachnospiraceae bacterium]|nr:polyphosphate polymerase domain-containing protein [Lachnospiraceae bacterium]
MIKFRNEWKYLVSDWEAELLKRRLSPFLEIDPHAVGGSYSIRSLYFDDYWDSAYQEKMMGVYERQKWRIRVYNCSDAVIHLERKLKKGNYIHKDSAALTREECDRILAGDYAFLLHHSAPLCREFYYEVMVQLLRPKVIVDYEREPYISEEGTVRITFDHDVRAGIGGLELFDPDLPTLNTLEDGYLVLEVKFTEFLPQLIREILPLEGQEFTAVSKYTLCYERAHHMTDTLAGISKTNRERRI